MRMQTKRKSAAVKPDRNYHAAWRTAVFRLSFFQQYSLPFRFHRKPISWDDKLSEDDDGGGGGSVEKNEQLFLFSQ